MQRISQISSLLKRLHRSYQQELIVLLQDRGFVDLRPSFLEILTFLCHNDNPTIKLIGEACGLKKQTMTSHLNELEKRGYIEKASSQQDKRSTLIHLTDYGMKFRFALLESNQIVEKGYVDLIGDVELDRVRRTLQTYAVGISNKAQIDLI